MKVLAQHFSQACGSSSPLFHEEVYFMREWSTFKSDYAELLSSIEIAAETASAIRLAAMVKIMLTGRADQFAAKYPIFMQLAKVSLVLAVTSVEAERTFSSINRIKTPARSTLRDDTLLALVALSHDGVNLGAFNAVEILRLRNTLRRKKLLSKGVLLPYTDNAWASQALWDVPDETAAQPRMRKDSPCHCGGCKCGRAASAAVTASTPTSALPSVSSK